MWKFQFCSSFFFNKHNSKTIWCMRILYMQNAALLPGIFHSWFGAVYELQLASYRHETVSEDVLGRWLLGLVFNYSGCGMYGQATPRLLNLCKDNLSWNVKARSHCTVNAHSIQFNAHLLRSHQKWVGPNQIQTGLFPIHFRKWFRSSSRWIRTISYAIYSLFVVLYINKSMNAHVCTRRFNKVKMAGWMNDQTGALVSVWGHANIQGQLDGMIRSRTIFERIAISLARFEL